MRRSFAAASALAVFLGLVVVVATWLAAGAFARQDAAGRAPRAAGSESVLGVTTAGDPGGGVRPDGWQPVSTASPTETASIPPATAPPPTVVPPVALRPPHPTSAIRAVALGDSLTAWPAGDPWPLRLDAEDPYIVLVHNAGVPGNTTAQMLARFGYDVVPYAPRLLLVLGGTNDIGHGIAQATTLANLAAIVRAAKARGMSVVLLTIPPDSFPGLVSSVRSLNAAIRSLGYAQGVPVVDIYSPLATSSGVYRTGYTVDGLHFSNLAARIVADTVRGTLAALGL